MIPLPIAAAIPGPVSSMIQHFFDCVAVIPGWHLLFVVEWIPVVVLDILTWRVLIERPAQARWMTPAQRDCPSANSTRNRAMLSFTTSVE